MKVRIRFLVHGPRKTVTETQESGLDLFRNSLSILECTANSGGGVWEIALKTADDLI